MSPAQQDWTNRGHVGKEANLPDSVSSPCLDVAADCSQVAIMRNVIRNAERGEISVTTYDRISSFLLSSAMFTGILVGLLFLLWITSGVSQESRAEPLPRIERQVGSEAIGIDKQFEIPGDEEVQELLEPTVESSIQAITEAVSSAPASILAVESNHQNRTSGDSGNAPRAAGPGEDTSETVPRYERWKLKFAAKNIKDYSRQLDFYGIELAAIGGGIPGVDYAWELSGKPRTRNEQSKDDQRLYFMWTASGPLATYDRQLLSKAGVALTDRHLIKLIPEDLETSLAKIELEHARENGITEVQQIARTVFESVPSDGGYRFAVIEQNYRAEAH